MPHVIVKMYRGHSEDEKLRLTDAIVPLLQLTVPGFADAAICVRFGEPRPAEASAVESLRAELTALTEAARPLV